MRSEGSLFPLAFLGSWDGVSHYFLHETAYEADGNGKQSWNTHGHSSRTARHTSITSSNGGTYAGQDLRSGWGGNLELTMTLVYSYSSPTSRYPSKAKKQGPIRLSALAVLSTYTTCIASPRADCITTVRHSASKKKQGKSKPRATVETESRNKSKSLPSDIKSNA